MLWNNKVVSSPTKDQSPRSAHLLKEAFFQKVRKLASQKDRFVNKASASLIIQRNVKVGIVQSNKMKFITGGRQINIEDGPFHRMTIGTGKDYQSLQKT